MAGLLCFFWNWRRTRCHLQVGDCQLLLLWVIGPDHRLPLVIESALYGSLAGSECLIQPLSWLYWLTGGRKPEPTLPFPPGPFSAGAFLAPLRRSFSIFRVSHSTEFWHWWLYVHLSMCGLVCHVDAITFKSLVISFLHIAAEAFFSPFFLPLSFQSFFFEDVVSLLDWLERSK